MSDTEKLQQVISLFENSQLSLMDAELDGLKVHLEKANPASIAVGQSLPAAGSAPASGLCQSVLPQQAAGPEETLQEVRSPLVGIFYAARKEGGTPLVHEGMQVARGDALCLIEAMKTMNELTAPCSGVIRRVLAENAQMVEFDQLLFQIEESLE